MLWQLKKKNLWESQSDLKNPKLYNKEERNGGFTNVLQNFELCTLKAQLYDVSDVAGITAEGKKLQLESQSSGVLG